MRIKGIRLNFKPQFLFLMSFVFPSNLDLNYYFWFKFDFTRLTIYGSIYGVQQNQKLLTKLLGAVDFLSSMCVGLGWFCVYVGAGFFPSNLYYNEQSFKNWVQLPHKLLDFKCLNISVFAQLTCEIYSK